MNETAINGKLLIDGVFANSTSNSTFNVVNPASEEIIGRCAFANNVDIELALNSTSNAWETWRSSNPWERSKILRKTSEAMLDQKTRLAKIICEEQGKPLAEAEAEIQGSSEIFDWCADEAKRIFGTTIPARSSNARLWTTRNPIGPVAAFTASNFPALLPSRKIASALAAGCTIVLKPAEETPFTSIAIAEILMQSGLPAGVLNLLTGDPAEISSKLINSSVIRKISLTGSVPVGRLLLKQAAEKIIPATMELGGHAACIVTETANINDAARAVVRGKWRNNGQVCIAMSRLIVHESIASEFLKKLVEEIHLLNIGPYQDEKSDVGPLASKRGIENAESLIENALAHGGKILAGGQRNLNFEKGYFFMPTLLSDVGEAAEIWHREPFAPVLPSKSYSKLSEAIEFANNVPYGLAGYAFTSNLQQAMKISESLEVGMVGINNLVIATAEGPAGGIKNSGFGREGGPNPLDDYLVTKYINMKF
jgi:succinate-semialdehyde dehydrogenase/glutarate-semialdehyde dehydrogenase